MGHWGPGHFSSTEGARPHRKESIEMSKVREKYKDVQGSSPAPSKARNVSVFGGVELSPTIYHRKKALCPDHACVFGRQFYTHV